MYYIYIIYIYFIYIYIQYITTYTYILCIYTHFFKSNTFISNIRLKLEKISAKAQQHSRLNYCCLKIIHFLHAQVVIEGKIKEYSKKSAKTNASFLIT